MIACKKQWKKGRYFLFEHPAGASSWEEECVKEVMKLKGVQVVTIDQCQYGLESRDAEGGVDQPRKQPSSSRT